MARGAAARLVKGGWLVATAAAAVIALAVEYHWLETGREAFRAGLSAAPRPPGRGSAAAADAEVRLPAFPPLEHYRDLTERPPFLPTRRPASGDAQASARAVEEVRLSQQWKLVGIVVSPEQTHAVLHERRGGRSVSLSVGMSLEGWTVVTVESDRVRLTSGTRTLEMELHPLKEEASHAPKNQFRRSGVYTPR